MDTAHRHDDVEVNLLAEGGPMLYLIGGELVEVAAGSIVVFWAAIPHQLIANRADRVHWLHLPFDRFLSWGLPEPLVARLLSGVPAISPPDRADPTDPAKFTQWAADLATGQAEPRRIAMLEIEARIRRLAMAALGDPVRDAGRDPHDPVRDPVRLDAGDDPALRQVVSMVRLIAARFREPITVAEIAAAANVHPSYAMTQFRKVVRTTIGDYLKLHRLAEARRLLATTDLPVARVAVASGFGSLSRFYRAFTEACGTSPARFRRERREF
jgi:AraC-like DNA-binding protein